MIAYRPGSRTRTALCAAVLFAINAFVARRLFWIDFTNHMESIEGSYMSISRWAVDHWHDLTWFPLWFAGSPFDRVYQPGLHLSVAQVARLLHWTPEHAYHVVTGIAYALGPVSLFWLCYASTRRRGLAFSAGLLYSLFSASLVVPLVRDDIGGLLLPRRYQILVHYGEGPHTMAAAMIPVVMWLLDGAATRRHWAFILSAPLALAALVLTNWPGTTGLVMALGAYALATLNRETISRWFTLTGIAFVGYLIALPWAAPSIIGLVLRNAQQSDATALGPRRLLLLGLLALVLIAGRFALERTPADRWFRFFLYFTVITGAVFVGEGLRWKLVPQAHRFQLEFDMAASAVGAYLAAAIYKRAGPRWRVLALCAFVVICGAQVRHYGRWAKAYTQPLNITSTIEYRMAKWFDANMQGRRVFAPGNVSLWMNMFSDVPQVDGCCDQGIPSQEYRIANYAIYTGENAGARDVEFSLIWLKAYGAAAIGVTGPKSTEFFKPYWNPRKFDGVLPELWHEGDNAVYAIPRPSYALAHVVNRSAIVRTAPENGLIVEPLQPLVKALDEAKLPFATFRWLNQHEAEIEAVTGPQDVVFVQVTYAPGWRATGGGANLAITPDALGMMAIEPAHSGANKIHLVYDGGREAVWTRRGQVIGFAVLIIWTITALRFRQNAIDRKANP
jgi:hypothetical protein